VCGGEGGVATEVDFNFGSEPAEGPTVRYWTQEGGFGEVHLGRDRLHPGVLCFAVEQTYGGGVSGEWPICEGVDLETASGHREPGGGETVSGEVRDTRCQGEVPDEICHWSMVICHW